MQEKTITSEEVALELAEQGADEENVAIYLKAASGAAINMERRKLRMRLQDIYSSTKIMEAFHQLGHPPSETKEDILTAEKLFHKYLYSND